MLLKVHITSISGLQSKNNRSICATFRGDRRESNCQSNVLNEFVHELFTWDLKSPLTEEDVLRIDLCEKMFLRTKLIGKYTLCLSQVEKQGFQAVNDSLINENNLSIPYRLCFEVTYIKENWEPLSPKTSSIINICSLYSLANYLWCGKAPSLKNSEEDFSEEKKKFSNEVTAKYGATMDQPVVKATSGRTKHEDEEDEGEKWIKKLVTKMSISETTFPSSNYNALSEKIRQKASPSLKCSLFCGGVNCKYCGSDKWTKEDQALNGFYSNWITEDILAMARPNTKAIEKHGLFESFEKNGIKTIINLQERNEHASCGQPLTDSGFSYDPQDFMNQQIYYYNYEWKDYLCVPSTLLLDMVKVVDFSLKEGKVAVHCHAGLGRTGVLIAAYILYKNPNLRPQDVIYYIRKKRKGSIQTKLQIEGVFKFYTFIQPLISSLFPTNVQSTTLEGLLHRQKYLLHGPEYRKLKYIPKFVFLVVERLKQLLREEEVYKKRKNGRKKKRKRVKKMKRNQRKDPRKDGEEEEEEDGQTASASSFLFLPLIKATGNDENKSSDLIEFETQIIGKIRKFEKLDKSTDSLTSLIEKTLGYRLIGNGNKEEEKERKKEEPDEEEEEEEEKEDEEEKSSGFISNDEVEVEAEDEDEGDDEDEKYDINKIIVWNFIHDFRMFQLNLGGHLDELKKGDTKVVTEEEDPTVLLSLLFTFFQNLKASFLNEESLTRIVTNRKLDKIRETTLEYLLDFLCLIQVVDEVEEDLIVKRLITELCRQSIRLSDGSVIPSHSNYPPLRCGTQKILFNFIQQAFYSRQSSPLLNSL